jgi:CubicO group peptidase (beta-lactamase class C family)
MKKIIKVLFAITVFFYSCSPSSKWLHGSPDSFAGHLDYSLGKREHALLVIRNDSTILERYSGKFGVDVPHRLASGTKSFSGIIALIAQQEGLLNLDELVSNTITEWKTDSVKSIVTIRELLKLTSGIETSDIGDIPTYSEAIRSESINTPGTYFQYGPTPFQVFGELMTRKLKEKPLESYYHEKIFDPLGIKIYKWRRKDGKPNIPAGIFITARDWAKFGKMLLNSGNYNGKQIVDSSLIKEYIKGSDANPYYGLTIWLHPVYRIAENGGSLGTKKAKPSPKIDDIKFQKCYAAIGHGKQSLLVFPDLNVVIVRFGETKWGWHYNEYYESILKIIEE